MEPLSIAAACSTLINNIAPLTAKIAAFVASVRDAREDMDATLRELSSLFLCLNTLRDSSTNVQYPEIFRGDLLAIIGHCDIVANQMLGLLDTLSSRNLARRIQWSAMGKDRMGQLRSSLETHKTALSLALSMTTIFVFSQPQAGTPTILPANGAGGTVAMNNATNNTTNDARIEGISMNGLTLEINTLRDQIPDLNRHDREGGIILQRFLDESTVYTESLADPNEHTHYDDTSDLEPVFEEHRPGTHQDGQGAPKKPDFRAMQATRVARSKISKVQRFELDHALEMLVRPKPRFKRFSTGDRAQEVRRLLDRGADISLPQCQSLDALSLELSNKVQRVDVVTLLLERGADPNTYSKLVNAIAYCRGCERPLLDYGASSNLAQPYGPNSQTYSGLAMSIHRKDSHSSPRGLTRLMLENYGADPNALGALAEAVSQASFEHVALLIEKGADVRRRERGGRTALHALGLHYSIWKFGRGKPEMEKILSLLLSSGADVNAQDDGGQTPLYVACQRRNRVAVRMLLDEGADASVGLSPASALRIWRPAPVYDEKTRTTYTPYPETRHGKTGTTYIPYPETRHGKIPLQYKNGPADDNGKSRSILRMLNAPEWVP